MNEPGAWDHLGAWDDAALVAAARQGQTAAFAALLGRHRSLVLRLCQRALGDRALAEDAAQEAALLALLNLHSLRRPERFGPWLAGIGLHVCRQWLRQRARDTWSLEALLGGRRLAEPLSAEVDPEASAEAAEVAARVQRAVADLPAGQRAAVALFYLAGLTHAETAAALGVPVGSVKTRLHRARAELRRTLRAVWEEKSMAMETGSELVEVRVEDVVSVPAAEAPEERRVVLLAEAGGQRLLPIWIGRSEADALAILLVGAETPRPLTFLFAARLLEATGSTLREVRVARLVDETFYAEVLLDGPGGPRTMDARPSDAIGLALATGAPIRVARAVLEQAGRSRADLQAQQPPGARSARELAAAIQQWAAQPTRPEPSPF